MPSLSTTERLLAVVKAAAPLVTDISVGTFGVAASVVVTPSSQQATAQAAINAFDWSDSAQTAWENLRARTVATAFLGDGDATNKVLRAAADVLRDEVNILRAWLASFKTEVAAATTLADLKTRVAGLPATPARTLAQLKTAITNRINDGTVDT